MMSDRPNETLNFTGSPPAHKMHRAQPWGLWGPWGIAALLALMDALLLGVLIGGG
jgi:hypothetical protein